MSWYELENASQVPSPSLLIFVDRARENIERMIRMAGDPARLRPHVKTHKMPALVTLSLELGITRFKCATLAEAQMLAEAGAPDVLLAYQPVGPNVLRLKALVDAYPSIRFSCLLDDEEAALQLSSAFADSARVLPVWLDVDVGMGRTGVSDLDEAQALYALLVELPGMFVRGLHAYDGHVKARDLETRTAEADAAFAKVDAMTGELKRAGFPVEERVIGGSPTFAIHAKRSGVELSPGTSVLWDHGYGSQFTDLEFSPAALVMTRVVSKPAPNRLCLDLGHKSIGSEAPPPRVHFLGLGEVAFVAHSEEHLVIETPRAVELNVGSVLYGVPWHACTTVSLYDQAVAVRGGSAEEAWPITARGRGLKGETL